MRKLIVFSMLLVGLIGFKSNVLADDGSGFVIYQQNMMALKEQNAAKKVSMCGETTISFDGIQSASDDEFLYQSLADYNTAKSGGDGATLSSAMFECDNNHCTDGALQAMGPNHVFDGKLVKEPAMYECSIGFLGDMWEKLHNACQYNKVYIAENKWYTDNDAKKIILDRGQCLEFDLSADSQATEFNAKCEKITGTLQMRCHPINMPTAPEVVTSVTKSPPKKISSPAPTPSAVPAPAADVPAGPYQCDAETLQLVRDVLVKYSADAAISALARKIIEFCKTNQNRTWTEFDTMVAKLRALIETYENNSKSALYEVSIKSIKTIYSRIDGTVRGFSGDVSVWKDAEGQFNTSRLVSDSVAGVVLGTAGGLITSSVVKKNQVKSGFEDINCTVGGQVVSGWGDEFNVGIR